MRVYTFTAWEMWFRNYYVAYSFVVCVKINTEELFFLNRLKIHIILVLLDAGCSTGNLSSYSLRL